MITDFAAIKNEKDREIYAACREALDAMFIADILDHDEKDHRSHECWKIDQDVLTDALRDVVKGLLEEEGQPVQTSLDNAKFRTRLDMGKLLRQLIAIGIVEEEYGRSS